MKNPSLGDNTHLSMSWIETSSDEQSSTVSDLAYREKAVKNRPHTQHNTRQRKIFNFLKDQQYWLTSSFDINHSHDFSLTGSTDSESTNSGLPEYNKEESVQ